MPDPLPPVDPEEAIDFFRQLVPMPKADWLKLQERAKAQAFTVAGTAQLDVIAEVWRSLQSALSSGTDFKAFVDDIGDRLQSAWGGTVDDPAFRLETIFRTNLQRAYSAGRIAVATDDAVMEDRPYWMFDSTLDSRTTSICKKLHGIIRPADDPWWKEGRIPPCHFNCRSTLITLTAEQADEMGGVTRASKTRGATGFGGNPAGEWKPAKKDYPPELWNQSDVKSAARDVDALGDFKEEKHPRAPDGKFGPGGGGGEKEGEPKKAPKESPEPKTKEPAKKREAKAPKVGYGVHLNKFNSILPEHATDAVMKGIEHKAVLAALKAHPIDHVKIVADCVHDYPNLGRSHGLYITGGPVHSEVRVNAEVPKSHRVLNGRGSLFNVAQSANTSEERSANVLAHEVGHHLHYGPIHGKSKTTYAKLDARIREEFEKSGGVASPRHVSEYAGSNHKEFFAECFSAYHNKDIKGLLTPGEKSMVEFVLKERSKK